MSKKFNEETIKMVWEMITVDKLRLREVAKQLDSNPELINKIYEAGYRRWGCNTHRNRIAERAEQRKFQRPPAVYSNKSFQNSL